MKLVINGEIDTVERLHSFLKKELKLPEHYGNNLDALWDSITGEVDLPLTITWNQFSKFRSNNEDYSVKLLELFEDAKEELGDFDYQIVD